MAGVALAAIAFCQEACGAPASSRGSRGVALAAADLDERLRYLPRRLLVLARARRTFVCVHVPLARGAHVAERALARQRLNEPMKRLPVAGPAARVAA
jgi:hypothetical protein